MTETRSAAKRATPVAARATAAAGKRLEGNAIGTVGLMLAGIAFMVSWFPETARFAVPGGALGALLGVVGAMIMLSGYSKDASASLAALFVGVVAVVIGAQVVGKVPAVEDEEIVTTPAPVRVEFVEISDGPAGSRELTFRLTNTGSAGISGVQGKIRTIDQFDDDHSVPDLTFECNDPIPAGESVTITRRWGGLEDRGYRTISAAQTRFRLIEWDIRFTDGTMQSGS
jgi:hypothetical protein